jgi:hypothetical protein
MKLIGLLDAGVVSLTSSMPDAVTSSEMTPDSVTMPGVQAGFTLKIEAFGKLAAGIGGPLVALPRPDCREQKKRTQKCREKVAQRDRDSVKIR